MKKQKIKWAKWSYDCLPLEDNYNQRDVLCKWEDGRIDMVTIRYERVVGNPERKYEGYFDCIDKPKYWAEVE